MAGRIGLLAFFCKVLATSCSDADRMDIPVVSVQQLDQMISDGKDVLVIDVRTQPEYVQSRPEFITRQIPYDSLEYRMDELPSDTTSEIYFFCRSGRRSGIATLYLRSKGYVNSFNVEGGIIAWQEAGFPVVSGLPEEE